MKQILELRQKSQITIPKGIIKKLNLHEGDKLEVYEQDGEIHIVPVAVYPVGYIEDLKITIEDTVTKIRQKNYPLNIENFKLMFQTQDN